MNCEQVKALLSPYLDNVLPIEERRTVATHLEICPTCNATIEDFRRFDVLLSRTPRISPSANLRNRIFSSPEYLELIGAAGSRAQRSSHKDKETRPYTSVQAVSARRGQHPQLVALPGGRQSQNQAPSSSQLSPINPFISPNEAASHKSTPQRWRQRVLRMALVATVLLVLGAGGLIGWTLWQRQLQVANTTKVIMPPAGLQQGPIPAGVRFLFLHNGALWSSPTDGGTAIRRLTPANTTVAPQWTIKPAAAGQSAGNMVAYIDLQKGFVHLIRSDGQNDITIQQPLLKQGIQPSTLLNTNTGATILSSLAWSNNGSMLAFVADPAETMQPQLFIYTLSTNKVLQVPLPIAGAVSHLAWSPDSIRIGFTATSNGNSVVFDYNTQNQGVLRLQKAPNTPAIAGDSILSLQWSPNIIAPALTWSSGQPGAIHTIWTQRVGTAKGTLPTLLASGNYSQATYSQAGHNGVGSWLLVRSNAGVPGDILSVDLAAFIEKLTTGQQVHVAQWSPNGNIVDYLTTLPDGTATLHTVNVLTGTSTLIATGVATQPLPAWFADSLHLAFTTGTRLQVVDIHTPAVSQTLKTQDRIVAFSWSVTSPSQLILVMPQSLSLVDSQKNIMHQLAQETLQGPILWTQIP